MEADHETGGGALVPMVGNRGQWPKHPRRLRHLGIGYWIQKNMRQVTLPIQMGDLDEVGEGSRPWARNRGGG